MSKADIPTLDDTTFEAEALASPVPVLIDFGATWCAPCRALEPAIEKVASATAGRVRVVKIDVDDSPRTAARYGVRGVPTVVTLVDGKEHRRHVGLTTAEVLLGLLPG